MGWSAAPFFATFAAAGMLAEAAVTPESGQPYLLPVGFVTPDELILGDAVQATRAAVEYQTQDAPALAPGALLEINGVSYRVTERPSRSGDGFYSTAPLEVV